MIGLPTVRRLLARLIPACLVAACSGGGGPAGGAANVGRAFAPATVFALLDPGESRSSMAQLAALATVDGLAYRARWRDLEPVEGRYDWSSLDSALAEVRARGKRLTIHVGVSGGASPEWLAAAGAVRYAYVGPLGAVTDPLPWDAVFLGRYDRFASALADHVQARGDLALLKAVSVGAPVSEMSLAGCRNNVLGGFPYGRGDYLSAWSATIGSHRGRFGSAAVLVSTPVAVICQPDGDGSAFYASVMTAARASTPQLAIFAADLTAHGSARVEGTEASLRQQFPLYLQTIGSATDDPGARMGGTLKDAVCKGLGLGAGYFELYKADLLSSDAASRDAVDTARSGRGCPA